MNMFDMVCPKCGDSDHIDVLAKIWVRLTSDGTDADESGIGDHEWDDDSEAMCFACNHSGTVREFEAARSLATLAQAARPIDDKDWGSERQIAAENAFCAYVETLMHPMVFDEWSVYALKATTDEMIDWALKALSEE